MATPNTAFSLSGLAGRLVREGVIDEGQALKAQDKAKGKKTSLYTQLLKESRIDSARLAGAASSEFGVPLLDLDAMDVEQAPVQLINEKLMRKLLVLPLHRRGTKLFVAVTDPTDTRVIDEVKFHTGMGIEPILVDPKKLEGAIDKAMDQHDTSFSDLDGDEGLDDIDISSEEDNVGNDDDVAQIDTPIVRFVNKVLLDAIKTEASDIHIEPYEKKTRVRYRVDGVLHEVAAPPITLAGRIAARVKILSRLDIAERRVPQDGRMKMRLSKNRSIDFRVSTLPTLYGEKVVIRILDAGAAGLNIDKLGFSEKQKQIYVDAVSRPYGMILVTGPTGSGKTVSLYTALGMLNTPERNVSTIEDPVEINLAGINQVNINEKANLTFAAALRAFLRQDPDVIMVGEVRDLETADIAIKASQTGHLVLSTLHTNDAPATLTRLLNMGVAPFNIASSVHLILAQRLVRRLCDNCKQQIEIPKPALISAGFLEDETNDIVLHGAKGCNVCTEGYKGRTAVFQMMPISEEMGALIMQGCTQHDIEQQAAKEGVLDLRQAGLQKVREGITSLEEIERVTNI